MSMPAGWYPNPDPAQPGTMRWWDGVAWTANVQPIPPTPAPAPVAPPVAAPVPPPAAAGPAFTSPFAAQQPAAPTASPPTSSGPSFPVLPNAMRRRLPDSGASGPTLTPPPLSDEERKKQELGKKALLHNRKVQVGAGAGLLVLLLGGFLLTRGDDAPPRGNWGTPSASASAAPGDTQAGPALSDPAAQQVNDAFVALAGGPDMSFHAIVTDKTGATTSVVQYDQKGTVRRLSRQGADSGSVQITNGEFVCHRDLTGRMPDTPQADAKAAWECSPGLASDFWTAALTNLASNAPATILAAWQGAGADVAVSASEGKVALVATKDGKEAGKAQVSGSPTSMMLVRTIDGGGLLKVKVTGGGWEPVPFAKMNGSFGDGPVEPLG